MAAEPKILWPCTLSLADSRGKFVYGWIHPLYCVAGVLKEANVSCYILVNVLVDEAHIAVAGQSNVNTGVYPLCG